MNLVVNGLPGSFLDFPFYIFKKSIFTGNSCLGHRIKNYKFPCDKSSDIDSLDFRAYLQKLQSNKCIIFISAKDEASIYFNYFNDIVDELGFGFCKPKFRGAFAGVLDFQTSRSLQSMSEVETFLYYQLSESVAVKIYSGGHAAADAAAYFEVVDKNNSNHDVYDLFFSNRGLNFLILSKEYEVIDLFSIDTYAHSDLIEQRRYYVEFLSYVKNRWVDEEEVVISPGMSCLSFSQSNSDRFSECGELSEKKEALSNAYFKNEVWLKMGNKNKNKKFCVISPREYLGWYGFIAAIGEMLIFAYQNGYVPIVDSKNYISQCLLESDVGVVDAYTLFYTNLNSYELDEVYQSENVLLLGYDKFSELWNRREECFQDREYLNFRSFVWDKFKLNERMRERVALEYKEKIKDKRVLGLLLRGTDYKNSPKNHSRLIENEKMTAIVSRRMSEWKCDFIYLVTEDLDNFNFFEREYENKLLLADQELIDPATVNNYIFNASRNIGRGLKRNEDYIVAIEVLAQCQCMISTFTNGSSAAVVMNNNKYENYELIDVGRY